MSSSKKKVLVIDDDERICRTISRYLEKEGFDVHSATSSPSALEIFSSLDIDIVLLDLNIPGTHGFEIAKELLSLKKIGIIFITGSTEQVDKIVGLELGADDYIQKPFDFRELLARIRSVLRRLDHVTENSSGSESEAGHLKAHFGNWQLDCLTQEISGKDNATPELTSHEYFILLALLKSNNRVLPRDFLLNAVSSRNWTPYDRSIDVLVGKLRKKLQCENGEYIKTIRGQGYKFCSAVTWSD